MKRKRNEKRSLSYGTLEPKRMLAGNVLANVQGEHIFIRGDQLDNQIRIVNSDGQIRIQGISGTTINGLGSVIVENSSGVADSDRVESEFDGGLRIHLGPGDDFLEVDGIRLRSQSNIYGGTGDDQIDILNTEFIDTAIVQTFTGDDRVRFNNTHVTDTLFALTLDGDDSLTLENSRTSGSAILATGNGDDSLILDSNQHLGSPQLALTQDGDDTVEILNPEVGTGSLEIYTGNGDDEVSGELIEGAIGGNVIIAGQGDIDTAEVSIASEVASFVSLRGFEFNNEVAHQNANRVDYGFATFDRGADSFFVADFVELETTTRISSIEWLGSYENSDVPLDGDSFVIEIFEGGLITDNSIGTYQAPIGDPLLTFEIGDNANRVDTQETWSHFGPTRRIFSYSADVDFTLTQGNQYWISIYSRAAQSQDDFYILAEDVPVEDGLNGAANVKWPDIPDWFPNTSAKTHFTLRS